MAHIREFKNITVNSYKSQASGLAIISNPVLNSINSIYQTPFKVYRNLTLDITIAEKIILRSSYMQVPYSNFSTQAPRCQNVI